MTPKKNLDSGLTPKETKEVKPEEKVAKVKDLNNLHEKVDAVAEGVTAILEQLRISIVSSDLTKRAGVFGQQVPPKEDIPNRARPNVGEKEENE